MERFEARLLNHSLRETMVSLGEAITGLDEATVGRAEAEGRDGAIERCRAMLDYLEGLLTAADARLVPRATLDAIHGPVDQALTIVNSLAADPAGGSQELDEAVENALQQMAPLVAASAGFADSARKMGRKSGGFTRTLKKLEGDAESFGAELAELESRRESSLDELTAEQAERRTELTTRLVRTGLAPRAVRLRGR